MNNWAQMIKILIAGDKHILGDKLANIHQRARTKFNYWTSNCFVADFFHFFGLICEEWSLQCWAQMDRKQTKNCLIPVLLLLRFKYVWLFAMNSKIKVPNLNFRFYYQVDFMSKSAVVLHQLRSETNLSNNLMMDFS